MIANRNTWNGVAGGKVFLDLEPLDTLGLLLVPGLDSIEGSSQGIVYIREVVS